MLHLSHLNPQKKLASNNFYLLQNIWKLHLHLYMITSRRIISHSVGTKTILLHQRTSRKSSAEKRFVGFQAREAGILTEDLWKPFCRFSGYRSNLENYFAHENYFFSVLLAEKMHSIVRFREKCQEKLDSSYLEPPETGAKIFNGTTFINANTSKTCI